MHVAEFAEEQRTELADGSRHQRLRRGGVGDAQYRHHEGRSHHADTGLAEDRQALAHHLERRKPGER